MKRAFLPVLVAMCVCGCRTLTPEQIALNRSLFDAARSGDVTAVRAAIAAGAQVDSRHESDWNDRVACQPVVVTWTPLHRAVYFNRIEVVSSLLEAGAHVDARDGFGRSPLSWGAEKGYTEIVRLLIDKGAMVNPPATTASPLRRALDAGHADVVSLLRQRGGRLNPSEQTRINEDLYGAAISGDAERIEALLYKGAVVDSSTPIDRVANAGNAKALRVLFDAGARVDIVGAHGQTPLHDAAASGSREAVELLVSRGADLNAKDKEGFVPLLWAMYNGKHDIMRLLLEKGADANARDKKDLSLLQHAINTRRSDVAELLRQYGAQK